MNSNLEVGKGCGLEKYIILKESELNENLSRLENFGLEA